MRRRTTALVVGVSALALPTVGTATARPEASPSARTGHGALMPKTTRLVRLTSLEHVGRHERAQRRLTRTAVRLRHRVAGAQGDDLSRRSAKRLRHRLKDDAPRRLRGHVRALRHRLRDARAQAAAASAAAAPAASPALEAIAACESGGDPTTNTGNGFYGKYQFTLETWASVGGTGNPAAASEAEQDQRAALLYARAGSSPWPVCGG